MRLMNEKELQREAERLIKTGQMPSIEKLAAVILETRMKYANQIRRARREAIAITSYKPIQIRPTSSNPVFGPRSSSSSPKMIAQ